MTLGLVHNIHNHPNASEIDVILTQYVPPSVLSYLRTEGARIVPLPEGLSYAGASAAVRRLGADVDAWPVPPAGLFVVAEQTVYIRSVTSLTVIHELGHALDSVLGGGTYLSSTDPAIRQAFDNATHFVTPYAASSRDEFFAECFRAYLGANDPNSRWPTVTRARLEAALPTMATFFAELQVDLERRAARHVLPTPKRDVTIEEVARDRGARGRGR